MQGVDPAQIILHGRSLGTAPALHLARRAYDELHWEIGGIILQCPFVSIRQVAADYVGLAGAVLVTGLQYLYIHIRNQVNNIIYVDIISLLSLYT